MVSMKLTGLSIVLFSLLVPGIARGAIVIDQEQTSTSTGLTLYADGIVQSFQQSFSNITGVSIFSRFQPGTFDVTVQLLDALPISGGTVVAGGSATTTVSSATNQWIDVDFGLTSITSDTTYFLSLSSTDPLRAGPFHGNDVYSRGQLYTASGASAHPFDLAFRTFADNSVTAVPEPSSIVLLGIASAALVGCGRRKSKKQ